MINVYQWAPPADQKQGVRFVGTCATQEDLCATLMRYFAFEMQAIVETGIPGYYGGIEETKATMFKAVFPDGWWKDLMVHTPVIVATFKGTQHHPVTLSLCLAGNNFDAFFKKAVACRAL